MWMYILIPFTFKFSGQPAGPSYSDNVHDKGKLNETARRLWENDACAAEATPIHLLAAARRPEAYRPATSHAFLTLPVHGAVRRSVSRALDTTCSGRNQQRRTDRIDGLCLVSCVLRMFPYSCLVPRSTQCQELKIHHLSLTELVVRVLIENLRSPISSYTSLNSLLCNRLLCMTTRTYTVVYTVHITRFCLARVCDDLSVTRKKALTLLFRAKHHSGPSGLQV
jgi:hypothetical protein